MKKLRLNYGKHPIVAEIVTIAKQIESITSELDESARVLPGRFNPRRGKKANHEIISSLYNNKELRIKINGKNYTQRLKIECLTSESAERIKIAIQSYLKKLEG